MSLNSRYQHRWILAISICSLVGASWTDLSGQAAKAPLASVTVVGRESGAIVLQDGGKKQRYVIVELDAKTRVLVASDQNTAELHDVVLEEHRRLTTDFMDKSKDLIAKQDQAGLK